MMNDPNFEILCDVVDRLDELADRMVFLGGATTGLLITDPAATGIRATKDIDVIVEVLSRADYYQLSDELRARGFSEDTSDDAPICRWLSDGLMLDVMPTEKEILGFGNRWYTPAIQAAHSFGLPDGKIIRVVTAPYFIATKLDAFAGRGEGDYLTSHDMEDMLMVVDGREELLDEINHADAEVRKFIIESFRGLLDTPRFLEALPGHVLGGGSPPRSDICLDRIRGIAELDVHPNG